MRRRHGGDTAVSIQIAEFNTKCVSYAAIFDDYVIVDRTEGEEKKDSRTFYFSFPNLLLLLPEPSTRHLAAPRKAMAKSERDCLRFLVLLRCYSYGRIVVQLKICSAIRRERDAGQVMVP